MSQTFHLTIMIVKSEFLKVGFLMNIQDTEDIEWINRLKK